MKASTLLDQIEITCRERGLKCEDRMILLKHLNFDLTELIGREDWDWAQVHLDPLIQTQESVREYNLPDNFPENFIQGGGSKGQYYTVMLNDGDNDTPLTYKSPAQFYSQDLEAESNAKPSSYTIMSRPDGRKQLVLSPPPDDAYTINGVFVPTDWRLGDETDLPPVPACSSYLKFSVLCRYDVNTYAPFMARELSNLYMRAARQRKTQLVPNFGDAY